MCRAGNASGLRCSSGRRSGTNKKLPSKGGGLFDDGSGTKTELIGVESLNKQFNPKTKQVFAALNYGRREHGSSTQYGDCYLVLHDRLKVNALYFGGDTFILEAQGRLDQTPYGMLGAVIAHAHPCLVTAIIDSCYQGRTLTDCSSAEMTDLLLEAHVFSALPFSNNLVYVCLPSRYRGSVIGTNADKFAKKHGAKVRWLM